MLFRFNKLVQYRQCLISCVNLNIFELPERCCNTSNNIFGPPRRISNQRVVCAHVKSPLPLIIRVILLYSGV